MLRLDLKRSICNNPPRIENRETGKKNIKGFFSVSLNLFYYKTKGYFFG